MEIKQIKDLMSAMGRIGLHRLSIKKGDFELQIEREHNGQLRYLADSVEQEDNPLRSDMELHRSQAFVKRKRPGRLDIGEGDDESEEEMSEVNSAYITSPIVGTFYAFPSPESPPFVKIGDVVQKDTVVCIVEAMKVMNEIKAGVEGRVVAILVESAQPIEFGTKLFCIQVG